MRAREPASFWRLNAYSLRRSSTDFSENVVVVETDYQMLECYGKKRNKRSFPGCQFLENTRKIIVKSRPGSRPRPGM